MLSELLLAELQGHVAHEERPLLPLLQLLLAEPLSRCRLQELLLGVGGHVELAHGV